MSWKFLGRKPSLRLFAFLACALLLPSTPALAGPDLSSHTTINFADVANIGGAPQVAVSGTTAVLAMAGCRQGATSSSYCPAILYQLVSGVWVETAKLQPAASEKATVFLTNEETFEGFGTGVAVSADGQTVFVGDAIAACSTAPTQECGVIDVYQEPAGGWQEMTPTAQLTASTSTATLLGGRLLLSGNDLFAIGSVPSCCTAVYEFTKPVSGWTGATVSAVLSANGGRFGIWGSALAYDASASTLVATFGGQPIYVFQGSAGSFSSSSQTAILNSSAMGPLDRVGDALSISGGVVAVGTPGPFGDSKGSVVVFVEPSSGGWVNTTAETAVLTSSAFIGSPSSLRINSGEGVVVDGDSILASGETSTIYVFNKPASGGWVNASSEDSSITSITSSGGPMTMAGSAVLEMSSDCAGGAACVEATLYPAAVSGASSSAVVMQVASIPDTGYVRTSSPIPVVVAGKSVTVEFGVQNIGAVGAANVTLAITAPAGTSGYSTDAGACPLSNGVAICALGFLPGQGFGFGNSGTVTFTAPAGRGVFTLDASVSTSSQSWDLLDNTGSVQLLSDNPPVVPKLKLTSNQGQNLSGQVGATDADQDALTYAFDGGPVHGTGTLDAQGHYTYVPSSVTYEGTDYLFYTVTDGLLQTDGIVEIDLNPPAQPATPSTAKSGGGAESALGLLFLLVCLGLRRRSST